MSVKKCWYILFALIMLLSLVSCNQNNEHQIVLKRPTGLSCSAPTYDDGATIKWNKVPNATGYIILIDEQEVARVSTNTYTFNYADSDKFCGKNCTIQAFDKNGGISLISNILIIPDKIPISIEKITFSFSVLKNQDNTMLIEWEDVNAIKYEIYIDSKKIGETIECQFMLSADEVFYNNGKLISIKVIEDNAKIEYIEHKYEISSNILITAPVIKEGNTENGDFAIAWAPVDGAASYRIYVDGAQYVYDWTDTQYVFNGSTDFNGSVISVRAVDIHGRTSDFSNTCIYQTSLIKPVLKVTHLENRTILVQWTKVKYAEKYRIYWRTNLNNNEYNVINLNEVEYIFGEEIINGIEEFEIYVVAIDKNEENVEASEHYFWKK
jgi:hypothetical protein